MNPVLNSILRDSLSVLPGAVRLNPINGLEGNNTTIGILREDSLLTRRMEHACIILAEEVRAMTVRIRRTGSHTFVLSASLNPASLIRANRMLASDAELYAVLLDDFSVILGAELGCRGDGWSNGFRIGLIVETISAAASPASSAGTGTSHGMSTFKAGSHYGRFAVVVRVVACLGAFVVVDTMARDEGSTGIHTVLQRGLLVLVKILGTMTGTARLLEYLMEKCQ